MQKKDDAIMPNEKIRRIALVAPSGIPLDPESVHRGLAQLRSYHCTIDNIAAPKRHYQRFAGTDLDRAGDLNRLADPQQPRPDIVLAVRGGYGATRLLHRLDYAGLKRRFADTTTAFVGYSDFTAIQMALLAQSGLITFSGPMLCSDFGRQPISEFTMHHFWQALDSTPITLRSKVAQAQAADVSGILWGGNLSIIASLIGTPYLPNIKQGILFLEDVNEQPYRIERMLTQLYLAGILAHQQAVVLGHFTGLNDKNEGHDLSAVMAYIRALLDIPVITGLPFGHRTDLVTLPVGAPAQLCADAHGFMLTVNH
jgi:muramoyltetrapeptide carboxypeptidase